MAIPCHDPEMDFLNGLAESAAEWVSGPQILASFALFALYGALDQVMTLTPPRAGALL